MAESCASALSGSQMNRNEDKTWREVIEPALKSAGWAWDRHLHLGPGRVNISGGTMYDATHRIVPDYVLRLSRLPLAILEAKAEDEAAADGIQQGQRYAERLGLRFSIASNGHEYILTDRKTGASETFTTPPTPGDILQRLGWTIDWNKWRPAFEQPWHIDQITQKKVRPYQEMAIFFGDRLRRPIPKKVDTASQSSPRHPTSPQGPEARWGQA